MITIVHFIFTMNLSFTRSLPVIRETNYQIQQYKIVIFSMHQNIIVPSSSPNGTSAGSG